MLFINWATIEGLQIGTQRGMVGRACGACRVRYGGKKKPFS